MVFLIGSVALGFVIAAWRLARRLGIAERELREVRLLGRELQELRDEGGRALAVTRAHLAAVAAGEPPERNAILGGIAYRDVQPAEALALYDGSPALVVVDVRTREEYASGHIPRARLIPLDELEHRLGELPPRDAPILVHCAAGGRSVAACETLGRHGYTRILNLVGGFHAWCGPREQDGAPGSSDRPDATGRAPVAFGGGPVSEAAVVAAIRECFDPEVPVNVYDLGLIYGIEIGESARAAPRRARSPRRCGRGSSRWDSRTSPSRSSGIPPGTRRASAPRGSRSSGSRRRAGRPPWTSDRGPA